MTKTRKIATAAASTALAVVTALVWTLWTPRVSHEIVIAPVYAQGVQR